MKFTVPYLSLFTFVKKEPFTNTKTLFFEKSSFLSFFKFPLNMKIITMLFLGLLGSTTHSSAQHFEKGDVLISPGLGLGQYGVGYGIGFAVPIVLNVDIGVTDYLSAGGYVGRWSKTWDYAFTGKYKFSSTHIGARGTFHWGKYFKEALSIKALPENMDFYITGWMGYNARKAKWIPAENSVVLTNTLSWGNRVQAGAQIGVRYFPKEKFGFFGEWGGTPTAYSNWGVTLKL